MCIRDRDYTGCRECHITPDWLLIYEVDGDELILYLTRTGDVYKRQGQCLGKRSGTYIDIVNKKLYNGYNKNERSCYLWQIQILSLIHILLNRIIAYLITAI